MVSLFIVGGENYLGRGTREKGGGGGKEKGPQGRFSAPKM